MSISPTSSDQARPTMLVDEKHRIIFCYIAKVGCTSWKWLLIALQGWYNISHPEILGTTVHLEGVQLKHGLKPLKSYKSDEIEYRLQHYHKIMAVRHPVGRIVSAYNDKFVPQMDPMNKGGKPMCKLCGKYGPAIIRQIRHGDSTTFSSLSPEEQNVDGASTTAQPGKEKMEDAFDNLGPRVTLGEFIQYITTKTGGSNRHWRPFYDMCNPCGVDYDYIVKIETLAADTHVLLPLIFNSTAEFPHTNWADKKILDNGATISDIPENTRGQINKRFGPDMKLFDYEYPWDKDNK